jgi:hypothetical protein
MRDRGTDPLGLSLLVDGAEHPVVAVELSGHRAAIRSRLRVLPKDDVRLEIDWPNGGVTLLDGRVVAAAPVGAEHLAHVEVSRVGGDWASFVAFLGPQALAS